MKKEKAVKSYQRKGKNGKMVTVKSHSCSYESAEEMAKKAMASKKGAGSELASKKKVTDMDFLVGTEEGKELHKAIDTIEHAMWKESEYGRPQDKVSKESYDKMSKAVDNAESKLDKAYGKGAGKKFKRDLDDFITYKSNGRSVLNKPKKKVTPTKTTKGTIKVSKNPTAEKNRKKHALSIGRESEGAFPKGAVNISKQLSKKGREKYDKVVAKIVASKLSDKRKVEDIKRANMNFSAMF